MTEPVVSEIVRLDAPYRRQILLQDVTHESGLKLLRVRIREGTRFTILDIDAPTARLWGDEMRAWADANALAGEAPTGASS